MTYPRIILMTCDISDYLIPGFAYLLRKFWHPPPEVLVCGFREPPDLPSGFDFYSIGKFEDYPADKWSDAFIKVLNHIPDEIFIFMLEDYWLYRHVDVEAVKILADYMEQFRNVIKIDLCSDRLGVDAGSYFGQDRNTYGYVNRLDLIKSEPTMQYHMSLWCGLFRRDLLKRIVVPGERAQEIELDGTARLAKLGDEMLVLGTRQVPIRHGNILRGGNREHNYQWLEDVPGLLSELRETGVIE